MALAFQKRNLYSSINRLFVIIPAAGLGTRMESDTNKQFIEVDNVPVIERTLRTFQEFSELLSKSSVVLRAIVVTNEDFVYKINSMCRFNKFEFVSNIVAGGETRMESVWKGIEALADLPFPPTDDDIVFIHDGARCLVDLPTLERCLEGGLSYDICAAAVPVKSTIKQTAKVEEPKPEPKPAEPTGVLGLNLSKFQSLSNRLNSTKEEPKEEPKEEDLPPIARRSPRYNSEVLNNNNPFKAATKPAPEVASTPDRNELMEVQTPQVFKYSKLLKSYVNGIRNNIEATDDTSLAEACHYKVHLVEGSYSNIKITTQEDISYAEMLLKRQAVRMNEEV